MPLPDAIKIAELEERLQEALERGSALARAVEDPLKYDASDRSTILTRWREFNRTVAQNPLR